MSQTNKKYDVIVVGAGLIGASLALKMAGRSELSIAVVERSSQSSITKKSGGNQRVVALGLAAKQVLVDCGVFESLNAEYCHPYSRMFVWDENTDGELEFAASDFQENDKQSAVLGHIIDSLHCTALLQERLDSADNIDIYYGFSANSVTFDRPLATISNAQHYLSAQLIVAADGNQSWVRQQAKIFAAQRDYAQHGIVAKISTQRPHKNTAWQRFLKTGPLAALPLAGNKDYPNQSSIVWSADVMQAEQLMGLGDDDFCHALQTALENRLGKITLLTKRASFALKSQQAQTYYKQGVVLIGDAAHSIHPLAGQGANLGFKDILALESVLKRHEPEKFGELAVLQKYQRLRRFDNKQTDFLMTSLYQAYRSNIPAWLMARGVGMNWLSRSASLKRFLVKHAMGL